MNDPVSDDEIVVISRAACAMFLELLTKSS